MIPLTKVTSKNATQFLNVYVKREIRDKILDLPEFLDEQGLEQIVVSQIICKPFSLLQVLPGTVHRGIGNGEDWDRILFWVTVDEVDNEGADEGLQVKTSKYFKELLDQ